MTGQHPAQIAERVPALMYHRIDEESSGGGSRYCVTPRRFAAHMRALSASGMSACSIHDFVAWLRGCTPLPRGSFLLTFDDGFLGVHRHALPVLRTLQWPAAAFVVSALVGKCSGWQGDLENLHEYPLLGKAEIAELRRFRFSIESHSRTHANLPNLRDDEMLREVAASKAELEDLLGGPVNYFAYPFGRLDERVVDFVRMAGYRAAFSVESGFNRAGADPFRVRRIDVYGSDSPRQLMRKIRLGSNDGSWSRSARYYARQAGQRIGLTRPCD